MENIQNHFKQNHFAVIKNFLTQELSSLSYNYCKLKVLRESEKLRFCNNLYRQKWDGDWGDGQIPGSYNLYGDPYFDAMLALSMANFENFTKLSLHPEYTYWRFYETGDVLEEHIDRPSCEISATLCLGYDCSNIDNYVWPIYIKDLQGNKIDINLLPGDLLIYRGDKLAHGRDKFLGLNHAQVFLHFKDKNGTYYQKNGGFDDRPNLGLPKLI
jgi:hypothetical protein